MKKASVILSVLLICILSAAFGGAAYADMALPDAGVLPEGVTLAGESLGGLTEEEATNTVLEYANTLLGRTITLQLADTTYDLSMEDLGVQWQNQNAADALDDVVMTGNVISRYKKMKDVEYNPVEIDVNLSLDEEALKQRVAEYVAASSVEAVEAGLAKTAEGFSVVEGQNSVTFDAEEVTQALISYINDSSDTEPLVYDARQIITEPTHKTEEYSEFRGDVLGQYTTIYDSKQQTRSHNIRLAAGLISGHVYLPGEQFSILELINPVTEEAGYMKAGTYANGQVIEDIGGGICQMATTIYDAALRAEMEITERRPHSMVAAYVPYAWDAMIYAQDGRDFKFVNNTDYPIYIEVGVSEHSVKDSTGDSTLTVCIYGTETRPANRRIEFRSETLEKSWSNPIYTTQRNYSLGEHEIKEVTAAHPKVSARCWKDVYVDDVLQETILINESKYQEGIGVIDIGSDITFDAWPVPGEDGWPKIYQDVNWTSSIVKAETEKKKQADAAALAEAESRKAAEESEAAAQASATPAPEAEAPAPEAPAEAEAPVAQ